MATDDALHNLWAEKAAKGDRDALEKLIAAVKGVLWKLVREAKQEQTTLTSGELMSFALACVQEALHAFAPAKGNFESLLFARVAKRLKSRILAEASCIRNARRVSLEAKRFDGDKPFGERLQAPDAGMPQVRTKSVRHGKEKACPAGHKYTKKNTATRPVLKNGKLYFYRYCRQCDREQQRTAAAKARARNRYESMTAEAREIRRQRDKESHRRRYRANPDKERLRKRNEYAKAKAA